MEDGLWAIVAGVVLWILARIPALSADARRTARARSDAELLEHLPEDAAGRAQLAADLDSQIRELLHARAARAAQSSFRRAIVPNIIPLFAVAIGIMAGIGSALSGPGDETFRFEAGGLSFGIRLGGPWFWALLVAGALFGAVGVGVAVSERQRRVRERTGAPSNEGETLDGSTS
ncbi:hypothetical protein CBZ_10550 [Cellulomonas biazotea]|uniref:Uncharacterized protein n=2 Tax=Cellulomonas biazotea TaxID=1709 RepID=A0A402DPD8_9CELL|nr:hypothetical protein CBZ_10550 [Cellulomonas biazotea]